MARGRLRSSMPTIHLTVCGLAMLVLASLSLLAARFLDLDHLHGRTKQVKMNPFQLSPQDLRDVPWQTNSTSDNMWSFKSAESYYGCIVPDKTLPAPGSGSSGFLLIQASGGLNQQRIGITDAVVVARILNATLVLPRLDHNSFWKDNSNFSDIFDADWFISALASDVLVIKELPSDIQQAVNKRPITMRVPRKSTPYYYESRVLPVIRKKHVLELTKFDYRLANKLSKDLQKLRCRVNYNALQFTIPIRKIGYILVDRMKVMSGGNFIALHMRFEADMLAFSGCYYGGGEKEVEELGAIRKHWKNLHIRSPEKERKNGKCPLSPLEVGLMLRALGFSNGTYLYVASGDVYGGEDALLPLKSLFPNIFTKETLATKEEMAPFVRFLSRMAAIDYMVCNQSDVFVSNNNGNMARILAGHRRYTGYRRTIRPNARQLSQLFLSRHDMGWDLFASKLRLVQKGFMGEPKESKTWKGDFFENPDVCICKHTEESLAYSIKNNLDNDYDEQFNIDDVLLETDPDEEVLTIDN